jgi:hypothetical protein
MRTARQETTALYPVQSQTVLSLQNIKGAPVLSRSRPNAGKFLEARLSEPFAWSIFVEDQYRNRQQQPDAAENADRDQGLDVGASDTAEARGKRSFPDDFTDQENGFVAARSSTLYNSDGPHHRVRVSPRSVPFCGDPRYNSSACRNAAPAVRW